MPLCGSFVALAKILQIKKGCQAPLFSALKTVPSFCFKHLQTEKQLTVDSFASGNTFQPREKTLFQGVLVLFLRILVQSHGLPLS